MRMFVNIYVFVVQMRWIARTGGMSYVGGCGLGCPALWIDESPMNLCEILGL